MYFGGFKRHFSEKKSKLRIPVRYCKYGGASG